MRAGRFAKREDRVSSSPGRFHDHALWPVAFNESTRVMAAARNQTRAASIAEDAVTLHRTSASLCARSHAQWPFSVLSIPSSFDRQGTRAIAGVHEESASLPPIRIN